MMGKEEEDTEEAEEIENYVAGEDYYSSIHLFHEYTEKFNTASSNSNTANHEVQCEHINTEYFHSADFINLCKLVAKYLDLINNNYKGNQSVPCKYLNYILNSNTEFNKFSNYTGSKLFNAYKQLSIKLNTCTSHIEYIEKEEVLEKLIKLYNLQDALNQIEKSIETSDTKICEHGKQFAAHHENYKYTCYEYDMDGFCIQLKSFEQTFFQKMKDENCPEIQKTLEYIIENSRTTSYIVPSIMILVTPLILFILYKFTPFGYWINLHIRNKKNIMKNLTEETVNLQDTIEHKLSETNCKFNIKYIP
ncbi:PIR protein [Plasmodium ovale]|uniref:PIR protein n=1 Tax=Plasmodium ovale TaxID=36330 RepID=A0A1D3JFU8_PLAOA|nr:PIR protein [Plasmodium ovale]